MDRGNRLAELWKCAVIDPPPNAWNGGGGGGGAPLRRFQAITGLDMRNKRIIKCACVDLVDLPVIVLGGDAGGGGLCALALDVVVSTRVSVVGGGGGGGEASFTSSTSCNSIVIISWPASFTTFLLI